MAKENYSKYEMNGVLKVLPFSHVSLHKSNTKCGSPVKVCGLGIDLH